MEVEVITAYDIIEHMTKELNLLFNCHYISTIKSTNTNLMKSFF